MSLPLTDNTAEMNESLTTALCWLCVCCEKSGGAGAIDSHRVIVGAAQMRLSTPVQELRQQLVDGCRLFDLWTVAGRLDHSRVTPPNLVGDLFGPARSKK